MKILKIYAFSKTSLGKRGPFRAIDNKISTKFCRCGAHKRLSRIVVDCAYRMHVEIGPGLLESVYEAVLEKLLLAKGLKVDRQKTIPTTQDFVSSCLRVNQKKRGEHGQA